MDDRRRQSSHADVIRRLGSRDDAVRERAAQDLKFDGPHSPEALLQAYRTGMYDWDRFNSRSWFIWFIASVLLNGYMYLLSGGPPSLIVILVSVAFTGYLRARIVGQRREIFQRGMAYAACRFDDPGLFSIFLELYQNNVDAYFLSTHLERALLRLKTSDYTVVTEVDRRRLNKELERCLDFVPHSVQLVVAILKALEQIGDKGSIPYVRRLATGARDRRIQRAAQDCLPYLAARFGEAEARSDLLRASHEPAAAELLRAASGAREANHLLRPIEDQKGE